MKPSFYRFFLKRLLDIFFSFIGIIVLLPFLFVVSIFNLIFLGWPIFFFQKRIGYKNKSFTLVKFRSMKKTKSGKDNSDEKRLSKYGMFLRKCSIDELPELFNILIGQMSFIGPRPLLVEYLPLYNERQIHRHDAKPGLTGLAQIHGRNMITWQGKFEYDVKYTEQISFTLDCKIFFKTIGLVFSRKGINQENSASAKKFTGNPKE